MSSRLSRKLSRMGRRRFVKTLSSLGVSAAALQHLTGESLAKLTDDPKKDVPRLGAYRHTNPEDVKNGHPPEREPVYYTIPRDEWEVTESAHDAARRIRNRVASHDRVVAGVKTRNVRSGRPELEVEVKHLTLRVPSKKEEGNSEAVEYHRPDISIDELRSQLPSKETGRVESGKDQIERDVPIKVSKEEVTPTQNYFTSKYRPVPAGCKIQRNDFSIGTTGTDAYDDDYGERVMVSAGHMVKSNGSTISQPDAYTASKIGSGDKVYDTNTRDCGTIKLNSNTSTENDLASDGGGMEGKIISGIYLDASLSDMQAAGEDLYHQGRSTGRGKGPITYLTDELVEIDKGTDIKQGDSGGPIYGYEDYDRVYIAGIQAWGVDKKADNLWDQGRGNRMDKIEQWLDVTV